MGTISDPWQSLADEMIEIPAGKIVLRDEGSKTNWPVEVDAFRVAPTAVTRELYLGVVGAAPASEAGARAPVSDVSWFDVLRFCNELSRAAGLEPCYTIRDGLDATCDWAANGYRLPREAEWEYACRAGSTDVRYGELDEIAWYRGNSGEQVHDVATRAPNAWGLYDTIGNVWEWCWDLYNRQVYGPYRVFRGGGWFDHPRGCRASCRRKTHPTLRIDDIGFRLVRNH
jgi:formylglycine-generating enzyme required for sulfatase activity